MAKKRNKHRNFNCGGYKKPFKTPEELEKRIIEYEEYLEDTGKRPMITGLMLFLGISEKSTLHKLANTDGYSHLIKRALTFVECEYEEMLGKPSVAGAIFALKNLGWKDRQEIETDINFKNGINLNVNFKNFEAKKDAKKA